MGSVVDFVLGRGTLDGGEDEGGIEGDDVDVIVPRR